MNTHKNVPAVLSSAVALTLLFLSFLLPRLARAAANETLYQTSFEPPAFMPGLPIRGQDNWQMFHDGEAISISTNNARTGLQCLQMVGSLLEQVGPNSSRAYCFSRALEGATNPPAIVEIRASVRLDGPQTGTNGTPDQDILSANLMAGVLASPTTATYAGGFFVSSAGRIWNYSATPGDSYKYSVPYTPGTYRTLALRLDFIARRMTWFVDGVELGSGPIAPTITADRLYSGYLELAGPVDPINTPDLTYNRDNYTASFDDYSLVSIPLSSVNAIIEFATTNVLADEFMPKASVTVIRRGFTNAAVRVTVSTDDDTAKAGEDYDALSTFVTFAAGETNKVVSIPLHDDYWAEPDKTFLMRITALPPGATSPQSTAIVLIRDDERPGSIDYSWSSGLGLPPLVTGNEKYADPQIITRLPDGRLILNVAVLDSELAHAAYFRLVRINPDGSVDPSFSTVENRVDTQVVTLTADGKFLVVSQAPAINAPMRLNYRLNSDGSRDSSFTTTLSGSIALTLIPQSDGKILVSGEHPQSVMLLNGQRMPMRFRLNNDGTLDPGFNAPTNLAGPLQLLTNGQLYLRSNYAPPYRLYRLNENGSIDSSFAAPANLNLDIRRLLPNGQILSTSTEFQQAKLYRLNQNGSLDAGFTVGTAVGTPSVIGTVIIQSDGKLVVGGVFRTFNGEVRNSIVRLNTDGSIDHDFQTGNGFLNGTDAGQGYDLWSLPGARILVGAGGGYDQFDGEKVTPPIILNLDGRRDVNFEGTLLDAFGFVFSASPYHYQWLDPSSALADGELYFITGAGLGRLRTDLPLRVVSTVRESTGNTRLTANALAGRNYTLQASETLTNWSDISTQSATTNRIEFTDGPAIPPAKRFYRVKQN